MGHKVNPRGIRLGITAEHRAKWYAKPTAYAKILNADLAARAYLEKALKPAGVGAIIIAREANIGGSRSQEMVRITADVARPGVVIGKKGEAVDRMKKQLEVIMGMPVHLSIQEVRKPELDAKLIAENIASQLVRRIGHRRAMKRAVSTAMRMGALGIKVRVAGRLGGTEIARSEVYQEGRMPLHEFKANIDRDFATAHTSSGAIGIMVWIHKELVNPKKELRASNLLSEEVSKRSPIEKDRFPKRGARAQNKK